jgi:hypothetical protein
MGDAVLPWLTDLSRLAWPLEERFGPDSQSAAAVWLLLIYTCPWAYGMNALAEGFQTDHPCR